MCRRISSSIASRSCRSRQAARSCASLVEESAVIQPLNVRGRGPRTESANKPKTKSAGAPADCLLEFVLLASRRRSRRSHARADVRQQGHVSGPLDGAGEHALFHGVGAGALAVQDLAVGAHHLLERLGVLVIDVHLPRRGQARDLGLGLVEALKRLFAFTAFAPLRSTGSGSRHELDTPREILLISRTFRAVADCSGCREDCKQTPQKLGSRPCRRLHRATRSSWNTSNASLTRRTRFRKRRFMPGQRARTACCCRRRPARARRWSPKQRCTR